MTLSGGSSANGTANVISDPTTGQALMLRTSTGMQSMYIYDGNPGSPIALITSGSYEAFATDFDPFGLPTLTADSGGNGTKQNPYGFASGIQDRTTGWTHFGNRYYDPTTGTWTQRDTLDHPLSPLDANRYAYAGGDPINSTDPNGEGAKAGTLFAYAFGTASLIFGIAATVATGGAAAPLGAASIITGVAAFEVGTICWFGDENSEC